MMIQKAGEGCSYAKTNQYLTFETNVFFRVKGQCIVTNCFSPFPIYSGNKD